MSNTRTVLSIRDFAKRHDLSGASDEILRRADEMGATFGVYATDSRPAGNPDADLDEALEFAEIDRSLVYIVIA